MGPAVAAAPVKALVVAVGETTVPLPPAPVAEPATVPAAVPAAPAGAVARVVETAVAFASVAVEAAAEEAAGVGTVETEVTEMAASLALLEGVSSTPPVAGMLVDEASVADGVLTCTSFKEVPTAVVGAADVVDWPDWSAAQLRS